MMDSQKTQPLLGDALAVAALCDMAVRRGLHAAQVEAEQAWQDVHASSAEEKLVAAWQWLFPGHTVVAVPAQLAHAGQLPAWVIADGAIGVVTRLSSVGEPITVEWLQGQGPADFKVTQLWVPVSPGLSNNEPMVPRKVIGPASRAIRTAIRDHRPLFIRAGITTVLMNLIAVGTSLFAMQVYDRVVPNAAYSTLWVLSTGVFIAYIFDVVFKVVRLKMLEASTLRLDEALSLYFFEKVMALKLDRRPSRVGTLVAQIRDYESIKNFFTSTTLFTLADLPFVIMFIAIIAMIGGHVAWVMVIFTPICLLVGLIAYKPMARLQREQTDEMARRTGILFEAVSGAENIKSLSGESRFGDTWLKSTRLAGANGEALRTVTAYSTFATGFFQQVATAAVIIVGVYAIGAGTLTMGGLIACTILAGRALQTISQITQLLLQWHNARYSLDVLNKVLSCPTDDSPERQGNTHSAPLDLSLSNLVYSYEGAQTRQLTVESLKIRQGERIIVFGGNGSGKTTLLRLLAGIATPSGGEVRIADLDMQLCRPAWLREVIGYLPQDVRLFSGTLLENLTMGLPMPDEAQVRKALEATGLIHTVNRHPQGLSLVIREGGAGLSGGQRQLVGLTRMCLQNPKIWLLDEPSASLDNEAEAQLQQFIRNLPPDRTVVFTSHRPNWLSVASRVLLLQDGQIKADAPSDKVKIGPASAPAASGNVQAAVGPAAAAAARVSAPQPAPGAA